MSAVCTSSTFVASQASQSAPANAAGALPAAVRRGAWQLAYGQAISLKPAQASVLRIRQGRVWVTRDASAHRGSEDLVLGPGDLLRVAANERVVMEPWDGQGATYGWDAER